MSRQEEHFSIAFVSRQTGIGVETLRAWERRYGRPQPVRLPSGHRRYTGGQLKWLQLVAQVMSDGHRAQDVLQKDSHELERMLPSRSEGSPMPATVLRRLLGLVTEFDHAGLLTSLSADYDKLGVLGFLEERVAPTLEAVGDMWRRGALDVRHEHFLSGVLEHFLRGRTIAAQRGVANAPCVVLATLPGELHGLGIEMVGLLFASAGASTCFLGTSTPTAEVVAAAGDLEARAVAISISLATCGVESERGLTELREQLPSDVVLLAGGLGARRLRKGVRGVEYFASGFTELHERINSGLLRCR